MSKGVVPRERTSIDVERSEGPVEAREVARASLRPTDVATARAPATERVARESVRQQAGERSLPDLPISTVGIRPAGAPVAEKLRELPEPAIGGKPIPAVIRDFNVFRSGAAFEALAKAEPKAAARWLNAIAQATQQTHISSVLGPLLRSPQTTPVQFKRAVEPFVANAAEWIEVAMKDLHAAPAKIGLPALTGTPAVMPLLHGTLVQGENGKVHFHSTEGVDYVVAGNGEAYPTHIGLDDYASFINQPVTIRGWIFPTAPYKGIVAPEGTTNLIRVSELAPGRVDDFVSGRVLAMQVGNETPWGILTDRGFVEFSDPAWANVISRWEGVGLIVPGRVEVEYAADATARLFYRGPPPDNVSVLVSLASSSRPLPSTEAKTGGERVYHAISPNPERSDEPTLVIGPPTGEPDVYKRRFVTGQLIDPSELAEHLPPDQRANTRRAVRMTSFARGITNTDSTFVPPELPSVGVLLAHLPVSE